MKTSAPRLTALFLLLALALPAAGQTSMFADFKARQQGDIITIRLAERTAASRESGWENASKSRRGGAAEVGSNTDFTGRFAIDAQFSKEGMNRNESVQSDLLSGTMTASIIQRDTTGNLVISGERTLTVNGETHIMKLSGRVRPNDIRTDNTIFSFQIANASIEYRRAGGIKRSFMRPGRLARLGAIAILGGAIAFALQ